MTHIPSQHALHHRDTHLLARLMPSEPESFFDESGLQATLLVPQSQGAITATFVQPVFVGESGAPPPTGTGSSTVISSPSSAASPTVPTSFSALSSPSTVLSTSSGASQTILTTSSSTGSTYVPSSSPSSSTMSTSGSSTPVTTMASPSSSIYSSSSSPSSMPESTYTSQTTLTSSTSIPASSPASANTPSSTSNLISHTPPFYVGIVLGTIVVIACMAALVAWWFRLRTHTRRSRRRKGSGTVDVPWARSRPGSLLSYSSGDDPEKGFGLGMGLEHDVPGQHAWEPRGDRDAGEPKRTRSFMESLNSPVKRKAVSLFPSPPPPPAAYPFLNHNQAHLPPQTQQTLVNYPAHMASVISPLSMAPLAPSTLRDSVAYPLPVSTAPLPQQPGLGHPLPVGYHATMNFESAAPGNEVQGIRLQFPTDPEFGTPRETVVKPRFLTLLDNAEGSQNDGVMSASGLRKEAKDNDDGMDARSLSVRHSLPEIPRDNAETISTQKDSPPSLPPAPVEGKETWTSSIKANFISAFNAVAKAAAGSGTGHVKLEDDNEGEDKLTALPVGFENRRKERGRREEGMKRARAGLRDTDWVEYVGGELVGREMEGELEADKEVEEGRDDCQNVVPIRRSSMPMLPNPFSQSQDGSSEGLGLGLELDFERMGSVVSEKSPAPLIVRNKNSTLSSGSSLSRRPSSVRTGSSESRLESVSRRSTMKSSRSVMTVLDEREEAARKALVKRMQRRREAGVSGSEKERIPGWV